MEGNTTPSKRRFGAMLAAAAACLAVALPVSGAFAQNDDGSKQSTTPDTQQQDRSQQERPRDDCPEKDGNRGEGESEGSSSGASALDDSVLQ